MNNDEIEQEFLVHKPRYKEVHRNSNIFGSEFIEERNYEHSQIECLDNKLFIDRKCQTEEVKDIVLEFFKGKEG